MILRVCEHSYGGITVGRGGIRSPTLVQHEFMHAMGVGHGCSWPSLQSYCPSGGDYRCDGPYCGYRTDQLTKEDVAYWEVREAVSSMAREYGTRYGLVYALWGERKLRLGLEPVPDYHQAPEGGGNGVPFF